MNDQTFNDAMEKYGMAVISEMGSKETFVKQDLFDKALDYRILEKQMAMLKGEIRDDESDPLFVFSAYSDKHLFYTLSNDPFTIKTLKLLDSGYQRVTFIDLEKAHASMNSGSMSESDKSPKGDARFRDKLSIAPSDPQPKEEDDPDKWWGEMRDETWD